MRDPYAALLAEQLLLQMEEPEAHVPKHRLGAGVRSPERPIVLDAFGFIARPGSVNVESLR